MNRWNWGVLLALAPPVVGCGLSDGATVYDPEFVLAFQVEAALDEDAVRVSSYATDVSKKGPDQDSFAFTIRVMTRAEEQGAVVGGFSLAQGLAHIEPRFRVDAQGSVVALPEDTQLPASSPDSQQEWWPSGTPNTEIRLETEPNPTEAGKSAYLDIPTRCWVRDTSTLEQSRVACTPCRSQNECRLYGESYLVGAILPQRVGVYLFWAWSDPIVAFTAPLDRPDSP